MSRTLHPDTSKNRVVVITGAAQGIGAALAKKLAEQHCFVIIVDIDQENGYAQEKLLLTLGYKAKYYRCDLSNQMEIASCAKQLLQDFEVIDVIINNAKAVLKEKEILQNLTLEWDNAFNVMLKHPILLYELLLPKLQQSDNAAIINIGSTNAQFISQQPMAYHVIKGALIQATRYLACVYGPLKIRVNLLHPGIVHIPERGKQQDAIYQKTLKHVIPLQRAASIDEIGECCLFLMSPFAKYITGIELILDGGEHLKDHFQLAYTSFKQQEQLTSV